MQRKNTKDSTLPSPKEGGFTNNQKPIEYKFNLENETAHPRTSFFKKVKSKVLRLFSKRDSSSLEQEVAELIEVHDPEGKQVGSQERSILNKVLKIGELKVSNIMIPRTDIVAVEDNTSLKELQKITISKEHTRMPVYKESLDNVIGFVHIKDLLNFFGTNKTFDINKVVREILFIPPSMKILDLLVKMRDKRVHMALVLDEYGGTDGLVTMEDLMEEIVGEIEDEHDEIEKAEIISISEDTFEVNARASIEELEEKIGLKIEVERDEEDFDTVGGLIFFILGKVPEQGEVIDYESKISFTVTESDPRRIKKLHVKKIS